MQSDIQAPVDVPPRRARPSLSIRLAGVLFILIALAGFFRFGWYLVHWAQLWQWIGPFVLWYQVNISFAWGILGCWVAWACLAQMSWARMLVLMTAVVFSAAFWIDRLVLAAQPLDVRWQMYLLVNILLMILLWVWMFPPAFRKERETHG